MAPERSAKRVDEEILGENQFAYFFQRAVLAKAFVGLGEPQAARQQFDDVHRRMDQDGIPLDFTIFTPLYLCLGEYCLQIGDIEQARRWAIQLRDYAAPAPITIIWQLPIRCWPGSHLRAGDKARR